MTNEEIKAITGTISYDDKLTSFLYELIRDHLTPGVVEEIMRHVEAEDKERIYCNGFVALYAHLLAQRLT